MKRTLNFVHSVKRHMSKMLALVLVVATMFTSVQAAFVEPAAKVERGDDGYTMITSSKNSKTFREYDSDDVMLSESTVRQENGTNVAITDDGENVCKVIYDPETGATKVYSKKSGTPDSNFVLTYEITEANLSSRIEEPAESYEGIVEKFTAKAYDYRFYHYTDGSHCLFMGYEMAGAGPNTYEKECSRFKSYAKDCDSFTYGLIKDIFGFIPGMSIVVTAGDMIYQGAIKGDSTTAVANALYTYALAVAETVCQPAKYIAAAIDGVSLLISLRNVRKNFVIVRNKE